MFKFILALFIVVAVVLGGLLAFRRDNRAGQPPQDVIDRVKVREKQLEAKERADGED